MNSYIAARRLWQTYRGSQAWEGGAAKKLPDVRLEDLRIAAHDADPNVRLLAVHLMAVLGDIRAIPTLTGLLGDTSSNEPSQCQTDEDEPVETVANAASNAILRLLALNRSSKVALSKIKRKIH